MDNAGSQLSAFASHNVRGRALFMSVPVACAIAAHAILLLLGAPPELGILAGCIVAAFANALAAWTWLDEPAAVALEKPYERGMLVAAFAGLPLVVVAHLASFAIIAAGMAAFGACCGIVRIASYSDAGDPPSEARRLASFAWLVQTAAIACGLGMPSAAPALVAAAIAWTAVAIAARGRSEPLPAIG